MGGQLVLRKAKQKRNRSWIKRICERTFQKKDFGDSAWLLVLECGHKLAVLETHYAPNLAAHWCPKCEELAHLRNELIDFTPRPA